MIRDVTDCVTDGGDFLRIFVGNLATEFLFKGHDQLDQVERICLQIFTKTSCGDDLVRIHPQQIDNNILHLFRDRSHPFLLIRGDNAAPRPIARIIIAHSDALPRPSPA